METTEIKRVMEAALLGANEPLAMPDIKRLFGDEYGADVLGKLLDELATDFSDRAVELVRVANGWRFQTRPEFAVYLDRLTPEKAPRYSRAVMETLAIIAYRQPVTRGDIEEIRGVSVSSQIVKTLEERGWIDVIGHKEVIGRPALFGTTNQFLDDIGLRSLKELPSIDDLAQNDETLEMFGKNLVQLSPPEQAADADAHTVPEAIVTTRPDGEGTGQFEQSVTSGDEDNRAEPASSPVAETVSVTDQAGAEDTEANAPTNADPAESMENR